MTYMQALYGSQHKEIADRGKDGAKGRFNANIFLAAFIIVALILVLLIAVKIMPLLNDSLNSGFHRWFGYSSGRSVGKLLAIPVFALIYFAVANTVGSETNFTRTVQEFYSLPQEEQDKANKKILTPFFIMIALMTVLLLSTL